MKATYAIEPVRVIHSFRQYRTKENISIKISIAVSECGADWEWEVECIGGNPGLNLPPSERTALCATTRHTTESRMGGELTNYRASGGCWITHTNPDFTPLDLAQAILGPVNLWIDI